MSKLFVNNLDTRVDEDILYELFLQAAPVVNVNLPIDRVTGQRRGYGFIEFRHKKDADYAALIMNEIELYGKPMRIKSADSAIEGQSSRAKLHIGNLSPSVREADLFGVFKSFGKIEDIQIPREENGTSKGYGFVIFESFSAADKALEMINGQCIAEQVVRVSYALKEGMKKTKRYGSSMDRAIVGK
ncbi:SF3B4 factor [Aduncisulcus paluster]|uniref:SF3B4 factor n=1 Tax=Aduncisulcus paluster TaxID=2918883 RepID=A0ABQ5KSC4_9EUKA|nr:SF3B4 factor [Aduncisulcus paluster]